MVGGYMKKVLVGILSILFIVNVEAATSSVTYNQALLGSNTFFNRFTIISDRRLFIIGDKEKGNTYEFRKPLGEAFVQLNMGI